MNKRSFATRKVYNRRPSRPASNKKPSTTVRSLRKNANMLIIWGLVVINVILIGSLIQKIFSPFGPLPSRVDVPNQDAVSVEILNGCGAHGIANVFSEVLREKQYDVVSVGNADTFDYERCVLIDRGRVDRKKIEKVASLLGVSRDRILQIESQTSQSDVTLILGADYSSLKAYRQRR